MTRRGLRSAACWLALCWLAACASPLASSFPALSNNNDTLAAPRGQGHVMQTLFLVESQAAAEGWSASLARAAGNLWLEAGDVSRALGYWEAAAASLPDDLSLTRFLAQQYLDMQQWADATRLLQRLVARAPDDRWAQLQLGLLRAPVDPQAGERHLRLAMREPAYAQPGAALLDALHRERGRPVSFEVGLALADEALWPYAELAFRHAAALGGEQARALAYAGLARGRQGKDGQRWIEQALAQGGDDAQIHFLHGLYLRDTGDLVGSAGALAEALTLDPENPAYHAEIGSAYRLLGDLDSAQYWLESAVRVSEADPRFEELLALFYVDEGQRLTMDGLQALTRVAERSEQDAGLRAGLGWALVQAGRVEEGQAALDAALALEPENPRALFYAARAALLTGDLAHAAELLRRVVTLSSPYAGEAAALLQSLP